MNHIRQHVPAFVDGHAPEAADFDGLAELLDIPFVRSWSNEKSFHKFSVEDRHLIVELRNGRSWWVVGTLKEPVPELPQWDKGIYEVTDIDGSPLDVPGRDVSYSQGDIVALNDGRKLKRRRSDPKQTTAVKT